MLRTFQMPLVHTPYQPVGKIKIEQPHVGRKMTSLLCLSDEIMPGYLSVIFNGEQEKELLFE